MHLLVTITSHGFGHAAQTAVVINALKQRIPRLSLTVKSMVPRHFLKSRILGEFEHVPGDTDFGLCMDSALSINLEESALKYHNIHHQWQYRVEQEAERIKATQPDLVLSNIAYMPLAAAKLLGIPSIALCSLNWVGIYRHYFSDRIEAQGILEQMEASYNSARGFMRPNPSMEMPELVNSLEIGCLATTGRQRRQEINRHLGLADGTRLVVVSLGGNRSNIPFDPWPDIPGIHWLVPEDWKLRRTDIHSYESLAMPFVDMLRSCDAVLGKCGYGTVAECACNGTPLLYLQRPDWPVDTWNVGPGRQPIEYSV